MCNVNHVCIIAKEQKIFKSLQEVVKKGVILARIIFFLLIRILLYM